MKSAYNVFNKAIETIKNDGLWKEERVITTPQSSNISTTEKSNVINMCANNYLGLSNNKEVIDYARGSFDKWGYGLSSVRFICGTQQVHKNLEKKISDFLGMDDTILYSSCFDANTGLFETILTDEDAIISDELNHASIIDGVRLCKAKRFRYKNNDMADLEAKLIEAKDARIRLIVSDGVFSMDGIIADVKSICDLADKYDAIVVIDDSHAVGVIGKGGRGSHEYCDVMGRVDIITGTLGKALGGASGGYTSGRQEIIDILRQRSRPYLFSNTLSPTIAETSIKVIEMIENNPEIKGNLESNMKYFRDKMTEEGFDLAGADHAIIPVMLYDELKAQQMAKILLEKGIYAVGFFFPVVPKGKARVRIQVSAAHTKEELDKAVAAFVEARKEMGE